jgi:capsular exopolysaccharide synthesis family protein
VRQNVQESSGPINLAEALGILRRRALLILVCTVVVAAAAYGFSKSQTKEYTATASLVFSDNPLSEQIAGLPPSATTNLLAQHASNVALVGLGDTAARTARKLGLSESEVRDSVTVSGQGESNVVSVSATATSPPLAARIATIYGREFVRQQRKANDRFFESALTLVDSQIEALPPERQFSPAAVALQNRAQSLRLLKELRYGNVSLAQRAPLPLSPSSPKTSRNTVIGGALGLLLGLGLAFILERFRRERRIMGLEDLESSYRLPLLGAIPESAALARAARRPGGGGKRAEMGPAETEAFSLVRARIRAFKPDLRTILVTSAGRGDGRTTIARGLAEAATRMSSRVLLLEADLRNPSLARQMDVQPGLGIQGALAGATPVYEAIRSVQLPGPFGEPSAGLSLDVLASGSTLPSNPGQLIESPAMEAVLDHLKSTYDLVVIDAPPVTAVSDAFSLLHRVDGVVVVSWIGRSPRDLAEQLREALEGSGAEQIGVVANGMASAPKGADAYPSQGASFEPMPAPSDALSDDAPVTTPEP